MMGYFHHRDRLASFVIEAPQAVEFDIRGKQHSLRAALQSRHNRLIVQRSAVLSLSRSLCPSLHGRIENRKPTGAGLQHLLSANGDGSWNPLISQRRVEISDKLFRTLDAVFPISRDRHMTKEPDQPPDVIELLMSRHDMVYAVNTPVPEKRRHHATPHIEPFISGSSVDQDRFPIRQFKNGAISLPHVEECDTPPIAIQPHARRNGPPTDDEKNDGASGEPHATCHLAHTG
jgi:hypothetical protein